MPEPKLESDDSVSARKLDDLGWVGVDPEDPEICKLRDYLAERNGIPDLEVVDPENVDRAVELFYRDGFVAVRHVLTPDQLEFIRAGCDREIHNILSNDKNRQGNRGSHRYSFGSSSRTNELLHLPEWAMLVDLPTLTPIVTKIFGAPTYHVTGGGGDFCLPGATGYQRLHSDMSDRIEYNGHYHGSFLDHRGMLTYRDLPVPRVVCNFLMVDFTSINGPIRQIPGTQHSKEPFPKLSEEPEWMKLSTVSPAPAGSVVIRDIRAWHGGTPNLSNEVRAMPNVEYAAPWYREVPKISMPYSIWQTLSDHGKQICRSIVADSSEEIGTGYLDDLGRTPYFFRKGNEDKDLG